eukprot:1157960-Pelagomonas_calceolata.AAC.8
MSNLVIERYNIASRFLLKGVSKSLASMDIGSADRLALRDLQIPEFSTDPYLSIFSLVVSLTNKGSLPVALMQH